MLNLKTPRIIDISNGLLSRIYGTFSDQLINNLLKNKKISEKIAQKINQQHSQSDSGKSVSKKFDKTAEDIISFIENNDDLDRDELQKTISKMIQCNFWKIDHQIYNAILDLTLSFLKNPDSLFTDDISLCTTDHLIRLMDIIGFHELSFYLKVSDQGPGLFLKKSVKKNQQICVTDELIPDSSKITDQHNDCNFHRLTTGNFKISKGGMIFSNVGIPGIGEDFTAKISNNLLFGGDDFTEARNIDKIIHIFELLRLHFKMIGEIKNLSEKAERDTLTGLFNREKLVKKDFRKGYVLFIDLDDFKTINDTYGHFIGDKALRTIAKVILQTIREKDLDHAFRYGGDEFIVYLNIELAEQAKHVAKRIVNTIAKTPIFVEANSTINETISMGCQRIDYTAGLGFHEAIKIADERLKQAKESGKNRFIFNESTNSILSTN